MGDRRHLPRCAVEPIPRRVAGQSIRDPHLLPVDIAEVEELIENPASGPLERVPSLGFDDSRGFPDEEDRGLRGTGWVDEPNPLGLENAAGAALGLLEHDATA